jgi:TatD DNase family protein
MFVDSHCHLNYKGLVEDQAAVLERARAAGVDAMLNISTRAAEWGDVIGVAERESDVWASVGIHPHDADTHEDVDTATLVERARHPRVVAIGESGLDFYYDRSDRDRQRASFRAHIAAAREAGLPIIVHTRDAEEDTHAILADEMGKGPFTGSSTASPPAPTSPERRWIWGSTSRFPASSPSRTPGICRRPPAPFRPSAC